MKAGTRIRRTLALGAAAAASLAMMSGVAGVPVAQARVGAPGGPSSPPVKVWITTANGQQKLSQQAPVAFSTDPPANVTVTVDPTRTFQAMTGFGGSLTDSSAAVLYSLPPSARDAAMHLLFDPATGDGLDFLRQPIGASDFVATQDYTYDDMPPRQTKPPTPTITRSGCSHRRPPGGFPASPITAITATPAP